MSHKLVYYNRIITTIQQSSVAIPARVILITTITKITCVSRRDKIRFISSSLADEVKLNLKVTQLNTRSTTEARTI